VESYLAFQQLKEQAPAPLFDQLKAKREKLPVPPVDVKQAWANNSIDRFADRFLISVNDFDDGDVFYVQNDITVLLDGRQSAKAGAKTLKQDRLAKLSSKKLAKSQTGFAQVGSLMSGGQLSGLSKRPDIQESNVVDGDDYQDFDDEFLQKQLGKLKK